MISTLTAAERHISVPVGNLTLPGTLAWPEHPSGVVILAPGTGPAGRRQRTALVARQLRAAGLATLLVELLRSDDKGLFQIALTTAREFPGRDIDQALGIHLQPLRYLGRDHGSNMAKISHNEPHGIDGVPGAADLRVGAR